MLETSAQAPDPRSWPLFRSELHSTSRFDACARVIVDSGAAVSGCRRVALVCLAPVAEVVAITGARWLNVRSAETQKLASMASDLVQRGFTGQWRPADATPAIDATATQSLQYRLEKVNRGRTETSPDSTDSTDSWYLLFEAGPGTTDRLRAVQEITEEAAIALRRCRDSLPSRRNTGLRRILISSGVLAVLLLIPLDFELEVTGTAFPTVRHRIFAPEDGIVQELSVDDGSQVRQGQVIASLRSAELSMQLQAVQGEADTLTVRLKALEIARSTAANSTDAVTSELIREEQQLQQKLSALKEEAALRKQQLDSLILLAPISGQVSQRQLNQQLNGRPVLRGQMLLEIGDVDGPWELELQVPIRWTGYLPPEAAIRFRRDLTSSAQNQARLRELNAAAEVRNGRLICIGTADIADPDPLLRPGQPVIARIHCGRRPLGFVLFRDAIEYLRQLQFIWF